MTDPTRIFAMVAAVFLTLLLGCQYEYAIADGDDDDTTATDDDDTAGDDDTVGDDDDDGPGALLGRTYILPPDAENPVPQGNVHVWAIDADGFEVAETSSDGGTAEYTFPLGAGNYDIHADLWGAGCVEHGVVIPPDAEGVRHCHLSLAGASRWHHPVAAPRLPSRNRCRAIVASSSGTARAIPGWRTCSSGVRPLADSTRYPWTTPTRQTVALG